VLRSRPKLLSPRQKLFLKSYLTHGEASRACKEAGYSKSTSEKQSRYILEAKSMQQALEKERERLDELNGRLTDGDLLKSDFASRGRILEQIEALRVRAEEAGNFSAQARCLEMLGKSVALFADRQIQESGDLASFLAQASIEAERLKQEKLLPDDSEKIIN